MIREKRKIPDLPRPKKRLKWWFKNNYIFLLIMGGVCLATALVLIFEVYRYGRTRNMEALLQKSRKDMRWGGITDRDVEILKKQYPNINWDNTYDRERWQKGTQWMRDRRANEMATKALRHE
jgi:hypothetical protein